jgi:photosystem II stability/assembly factor-like uncharacterized protein
MADTKAFTSTRFPSQGRTWQRRTGSIAAAVFVTLLVGSLIFVLTRAHHSGLGELSNTSSQFGAIVFIHMLDAGTGWAMTDRNSILHTTDGGVHWQQVTPHYPASRTRQGVVADFLTASSAWVAVSGIDMVTAAIFRTVDAGQTWQQTTIQTRGGIVTKVNFITAQDGWLLSKHRMSESAETLEIFSTTDGGKTWIRIAGAFASSLDIPPPGHLPFSGSKSGLSFLNATTGWVTGRVLVNGSTLLYQTRDSGSTWYRQSLPLSPIETSSQLSILPPLFFNATEGILPVSFNTGNSVGLVLYVTRDGGSTWKGTTPLAASASAADFIDVDHGWASDGTLLYVTSDSGQHWTKLPPGGSFQHVTQLDFVSSSIGWAIGATESGAPTLLKTEDGGHTWMVISYAIS